MISSNKRFSYAPASSSGYHHPHQLQHSHQNPLDLTGIPSTGNGHHHNNGGNDVLQYRKAQDRNSLSLNHEFSHMYISNKQNPNKHSFTSRGFTKNIEPLPSLDEVNKHKKNAAEAKKQMMQMEKSISFWCDCTDYWRTKWKKTKEEKKQITDKVKELRTKVSQLEKQLKVSEEKRLRLNDKFNTLVDSKTHLESVEQKKPVKVQSVSRIPRYETNSLRQKKSFVRPQETEVDEEEFTENTYGQIIQPSTSTSNNPTSSKVVLRNHDRMFDKKINNRKRFSQVVMCDDEELFEFNNINDNATSGENTLRSNDAKLIDDHIPEEDEHDGDDFEEDEEESSEMQRSDDLRNVSLKVRHHLLQGSSNVSTLETNSERVNVGSINDNEDDDDNSTAIPVPEDDEQSEDDDADNLKGTKDRPKENDSRNDEADCEDDKDEDDEV